MAKETTSNSTKAIVGGSYRQVRRGTQDFGAMTENIEEAAKPGLGLLAERQAFKKQLDVDYDKSKSEYDADIDKTIASIGTISGSESLSPLEQERAFKANAKLKEKLRLKLSQGAGTYAAATANKDAQGQRTVMENNESVLTQTNGVKEFVNAWSQPDVYHGEATDQTFDSNEFDSNGKPLPGLSLEYFVNANNTRPDSVDFEEGTTNDGEKKMMVSIVDDNGVKRFLDMDKFNDPETLAQTFRVRADVTTSLAEYQKQNPHINPVYETVKTSDFNDGETMQYGSETKTINKNTQKVYQEGAARYASDFVNKNPSLLYSVYADMVKSNFKPEANEGGLALEGFDENTVFEFGQMEKGSKFYGKMSDEYIEEFARKFNIANAVKDPPEPKLTLQEVKTKIHDAQKSMVENYLQQQALADTPGYELNDNGNAVLVDQLKDTTRVEQKLGTSSNVGGSGTIEELDQRYVKVNEKMNAAVDGINNAKGLWWKSGEPGQPTASVDLFNANVGKIADVLNTYTTGEGSPGINFENRANATARFESSLDEDGLFVLKNGETLTKGETDDLKKNFDNPKNLIFEFSENGKLTSHAFGDEGPTVQALGEILRGKIANQHKDEYDKVFYSKAIENKNLNANKQKVFNMLDDMGTNPTEYDEGVNARVSAFTSPNMSLGMQFEYLQKQGVSANNNENDPLFGSLSTAQQIKYLTLLKENVDKK